LQWNKKGWKQMDNEPRYRQLYEELKKQIQQDCYSVGELLPSENDLCSAYQITRTTVRKALDELQKEGYIDRLKGKGSIVCEHRKTLGLLTVKGFSETVNQNIKNVFVSKPDFAEWDKHFPFQPSQEEAKSRCIRFGRLRCVEETPTMFEESWLSSKRVPDFMDKEFVQGSFFKTLSQRYLIEITGSEHEIRAIRADQEIAESLHLSLHEPVLYIAVRYQTNIPNFYIYSKLYCNTNEYPIGNKYLSR